MAGAQPAAPHQWPDSLRSPFGAPLVLGHRGAQGTAPENTIASYEAALRAGADGIETDVQRTKDGHLVLHHDARVPSVGAITNVSLAQLRSRRPEIPTLDELAGLLANYPSALVNLELKGARPKGDVRAEDLAAWLKACPEQIRARVWVSSFEPDLLLRLSKTGVGVPLAYLAWRPSDLAAALDLPVAAVHPQHRLVTGKRMEAWRSRDLKVFAWTVNRPEDARRLAALGVDGLIGDDPGLLRTSLAP